MLPASSSSTVELTLGADEVGPGMEEFLKSE